MSLFYCITFILLQLPGISLIENKVRSFQHEAGISQGVVAFSVKDCSSDKYLIDVNSLKSVNSASTFKLITTATAIEVLGKDYRFFTELGYSGSIVNNQLNGNLYFSGNGDPSFGSDRWGDDFDSELNKFVQIIHSVGINKITGNLVMMNSAFESFDVADTWVWNDLGNYYGATPYLLNINENKFDVYFNAGNNVGSPAQIVSLKPSSSQWKIINQVTTAEYGTGDNVYIYSSPLSNTILMKGTVPLRAANFKVRGSVPNPPQLLGELFLNKLKETGVDIDGQVTFQSYSSADFKKMRVKQSKPLQDLAESCNFSSINLVADALLKQIGYQKSGKYAYDAGLKELQIFWNAKGVNTQELLPKDGSGLSPTGTITTSVMCDILDQMQRSKNFAVFRSTIPQLGISGTVARIGNRSNGNVYVKSGSIDGTRAYAGYVKTASGKWLSFMICVNRYHPDASAKVNGFLKDILLDLSNLN